MDRLTAAGAASYTALGVAALARPERIPAVFGGTATTPDARTEVRAVYGGLPLALAATLAARPRSAATVGVLTAGMAAGRALSAAVEPGTTRVTPAFVVVESVVAALLLRAGRRA